MSEIEFLSSNCYCQNVQTTKLWTLGGTDSMDGKSFDVFFWKQELSQKCSDWTDFGLLFWSLLLQRKSKVCGLRWEGMDELEVESVALNKKLKKA